MRHVVWLAMAGVLVTASIAAAEPWWFDFEFNDPNDLPPANADGWLRRFQPEPFGVVQDGILTYSSGDPSSYDFWEYSRPGDVDPDPNEVFVCEWRLWTERVSYWADPSVAIDSDDAWTVCFVFGPTSVTSFCEYIDIPLEEGWHTYRFLSATMRNYTLYIDGTVAREGCLAQRFITSLVDWGDGTDGAASTNHWDYFRFGVMRAPRSGDVNCDGVVGFGDINPFIQALTERADYRESYPGCWPENADINGDGSVDFLDINPFIDLLIP